MTDPHDTVATRSGRRLDVPEGWRRNGAHARPPEASAGTRRPTEPRTWDRTRAATAVINTIRLRCNACHVETPLRECGRGLLRHLLGCRQVRQPSHLVRQERRSGQLLDGFPGLRGHDKPPGSRRLSACVTAAGPTVPDARHGGVNGASHGRLSEDDGRYSPGRCRTGRCPEAGHRNVLRCLDRDTVPEHMEGGHGG